VTESGAGREDLLQAPGGKGQPPPTPGVAPRRPGFRKTGPEQESLYLGVGEGGSHLDGWGCLWLRPHIPPYLKKQPLPHPSSRSKG
jgi:hypothetical protein